MAPERESQLVQEPAAAERRRQFLSALARNLQEAAAGASRCATPERGEPQDTLAGSHCGTPVGTSRCSTPLLRVQGSASTESIVGHDKPVSGECTAVDPEGALPGNPAASAVASVLGPDFFAGVDALKERMAQRKASSKVRAGPAKEHGLPFEAFAAAPPPAPGVPPPLPAGLSPRGGGGRRASAGPPGPQAAREPSPAGGRGGSPAPLPRSERRRPRPEGSPPEAAAAAAAAEDGGAAEEAPAAAEGCGEELLRWADEVLRRAQGQGRGEGGAAPAPPRAPPPGARASPRAGARERRAEELREKMRLLMAEAEGECARLSAEEAARQRRLAAERTAFQDRLNSAAEEMRSNFAQWSFDAAKGPHAHFSNAPGAATASSQRSGSLPPPHQPRAPEAPCGGRGGGRPAPALRRRGAELAEHEAAWARLEERLEGGAGPVHFADIPWPDGQPGSLTGIAPGEAGAAAKRRLAIALRRWHPDKWRRILDRVPEAEQRQVMERVKSIAQRLLEEKARLAGPGGALR